MHVYLNGLLVTTLRDSKFQNGLIHLVLRPGKKSAILMAFSDLQLREALYRG